jgi:copper transport protein
LLALSTAKPAYAHALLLRSDPVADVVLPQSPARVHLWFSEDLNGAASRIIVWDWNRQVENVGNATLVPGQSRQLEVGLRPLPAGSYLVLWTSVSAQDGHVLHGSYLFSVKHPGPGPSLAGVSVGGTGQTFPDGPTLASILAHWLELLTVVAWVGSVVFSLFVFPVAARRVDGRVRARERSRLRLIVQTAVVALVCSSAVLIAVDAYNLAGQNWTDAVSHSTISAVFSAQYGQLWIGRQALALVGLLTTFGFGLRVTSNGSGRPRDTYAVMSCFVIGVIYLYTFAASGHAASAAIGDLAGSHIASASVGIDWLHFTGDSLWFGGQIYIVLVLIPILGMRRGGGTHGPIFLDTLNRFSPLAYLSIGFFIASGAFAGVVHIPSWYAFFHSAYGWTLIIKMGLIGLMMLTSAVTVYLIRPEIRRTTGSAELAHDGPALHQDRSAFLMRRLVQGLGINPVLGLGVLLATSVMFYYPVPPGLSPPGPSAYTVQGGGFTATLTVKPDRSGLNTFDVLLQDTRGRPVQQAHITVLTTMLDMVMGTGLAQLTEGAPGHFSGSTDLGMGGRWRILMLIYTPSGFTRLPVEIRVGT